MLKNQLVTCLYVPLYFAPTCRVVFSLCCCLLGQLDFSLSWSVLCVLFWLFWLSCRWLARKTPLRKPNRGEGIVSRKPRPKSAHDFLGLLYCFVVLLCICVVFFPYVIYYPTVMARYSLFVLKVPLNPKQTNNPLMQWLKWGWGARGAHPPCSHLSPPPLQ